uniref:Fucosyltransferase n=1 Tax=Lotharella globosa TaxID=91324 RepID=A0A7S4E0P9_9EUKA
MMMTMTMVGGGWFANKNAVVQKHPFYLAFENSNLTEYVTEKLYSGYFAGVVPVFWGSPGVTKVAPKGSFVNANDFKSPRELALKLKEIASDYDVYKSYFDYLPDGLSNLFDELCEDSLMCRICKKTKQMKEAESN